MKLLLLLTITLLSGCASLNYAGNASYTVKPFVDEKGAVHCCEVTVHNGKEIGHLVADIKASADGSYKVHLEEVSVKAFEGQRIAASVANTTMKSVAPIVSGIILP